MSGRFFAAALFLSLALVACDRQGETGRPDLANGPQMDSPAPESEPARSYAPASESARATTGRLTIIVTTRMPESQNASPTDVLSLRAETGLMAEAELEGAVQPSANVEGQTIRALMDLPVDAGQTLVYRITRESTPRGGRGLCGDREATRLVVWEPMAPGESSLKILALAGEAPGRPGAQLCAAFAYARPAT